MYFSNQLSFSQKNHFDRAERNESDYNKKICFFDKQKKNIIFSTGGIPYDGWSQSTTMKKIEEGYRLPKPEHIDDSL